jgi:integrase
MPSVAAQPDARLPRAAGGAGLPALRWHDLRHSAGSLLYEQGVDLPTIKEILGHSRIAITADLCTHVAASVTREVAAVMGDLLAPRKPPGRQGGRQTG